MTNYRPISLLTTFSKILDIVMKTRLLNHLTQFNILTKKQFGFRTKLTTENATYTLNNKIFNAFNNKLNFVTYRRLLIVCYDILLSELEYYGIQGTDKALYKSYLYNRYQTVPLYEKDTYKFSFSKWAEVKSGIPQGSTLGPLLFLIYINDLLKATNNRSMPILFVDDTTILFSHSNPDDFVVFFKQ
jgi:hypothetical protein